MKLAVDLFLKLDVMYGEAQDRMHAKEIAVIAWSWGATQNSASPIGVCRAGATPLDYLIVKMTNISVKSLSTGGSIGDDRLMENVALRFSKVKIEYVPQQQDGNGGAAMTAGWDAAANRPAAG